MDKASFFSACTLPSEEYKMPNGEFITIKGLTARARQQWLDAYEADSKKGSALLIVAGCDIFDDSDIDSIMDLASTVFDDMSSIVMKLSGMDVEEVMTGKDVTMGEEKKTD